MYLKFIVIFCFIAAGLANIGASYKKNDLLFSFTKPFLMPLLLTVYIFSAKTINMYIVAALISGFLGDVLLMREEKFLPFGIISFLTGHIFYIIAFLQNVNFSKLTYMAYLPFLLYVIYLIMLFKNVPKGLHRGKLLIIVYMLFIATMSFSSLLRGYFISGNAFWFTFIGSLFFIASDSLIFINRFKKSANVSNTVIMLTYIIGQTLIIAGFI